MRRSARQGGLANCQIRATKSAMATTIYCFYNNKGGVGKTTLCQHAAALFAENHPKTHVLVVDMCPQANVSQFLLGGGHVGYTRNQALQTAASRKNIVGFVDWLLRGNSGFGTPNTTYSVQVSKTNPIIAPNLHLIAGDNFLESLSLALNYAVINPANIQAWSEFMTALRRLCEHEHAVSEYKRTTVFIDCNPSFSVYTQMALLSSDRVVIPMMADFTSIEGIKGIFAMLYGKYPSQVMQRYAQNVVTFTKQVERFGLTPPVVFELAFNNYTVKAGIATAFDALRRELTEFCYDQYCAFPELFAPVTDGPMTDIAEWGNLFVSDIKDFHTAGKVSATLGIPLHRLPERTTYHMPDGTVVKVPAENYTQAVADVRRFVDKLM
jgi:cellulose biosynthesis protein BcsQ